jgi:hypothetical protein
VTAQERGILDLQREIEKADGPDEREAARDRLYAYLDQIEYIDAKG